jgi:autophagy-related protein 11
VGGRLQVSHEEQDVGAAREDFTSQTKLEDKVKEANRIIAQLLEIGDAYRMTYHKALNSARAAVTPSKQDKHAPAASDEPTPFIGPSDRAGAIGILRAFDHNEFLEVIEKTGFDYSQVAEASQ